MFDRLQKPFLTVETGEAYQPIRLAYDVIDKEGLLHQLDELGCIQKNAVPNSWAWYWMDECDDLHFESLVSFRKQSENPIRLATLTLRESKLYVNLTSFKRACLAVPFFYKIMSLNMMVISSADFINKVFAVDERLPHGFAELFKEDELSRILNERVNDYHKVQEKCEQAATAEEAFSILSEHTKKEAKKRLPYAERYLFDIGEGQDTDVVFLAFYIFLRGRELVAIKRWFGQTGYTLADAADEAVEQVFGGIGIDIIE